MQIDRAMVEDKKTPRGWEREYRQSPEDRKKVDGVYECILYVHVALLHALPTGGTLKSSLEQLHCFMLTDGSLIGISSI